MDIKQVATQAQNPAVQQTRTPAPSAGVTAPPATAKQAAVSTEQLDAAVKALNKSLESTQTGIEFSVDKEAHTTIVKVVDQSTKEVLRQIPSEEALEMAKALDKMQGLLIQNQA
jgi:flagellar protein FlaG